MNLYPAVHALQGGTATACFAAGVFFLRLFVVSRDRFFLWFCFALWILGAHWGVLALDQGPEEAHYLYATRALAFVLIIGAIVDENRSRRASASAQPNSVR